MEIVRATSKHLAELLAWLEEEERETGEGFNCNRELIENSQPEGNLYCALQKQAVVGFAVHHRMTEGASISLLEVRLDQRGLGIGKALATHAIGCLFRSGANFIKVECAPHASEPFWKHLGFQPTEQLRRSIWENPRLVLHNNQGSS